jgi:hypothetical protein
VQLVIRLALFGDYSDHGGYLDELSDEFIQYRRNVCIDAEEDRRRKNYSFNHGMQGTTRRERLILLFPSAHRP